MGGRGPFFDLRCAPSTNICSAGYRLPKFSTDRVNLGLLVSMSSKEKDLYLR